MNIDEQRRGYQGFFLSSDAGKHFTGKILEMIETNHAKAESEPEMARDYAQRAKGMREVLSHIKSTLAGGQTPKE